MDDNVGARRNAKFDEGGMGLEAQEIQRDEGSTSKS